jgi:signal transduction histidine kinase
LHRDRPDKSLQALNISKTLSSQSLAEVRRALQTIQEKNFDFDLALATVVEQIEQNQTFEMRSQINLPKLPLSIGHQLYCIIKEGLTNIQKHAQASQVTIKGYLKAESIILEIADDGIGFNPELPHDGLGLLGTHNIRRRRIYLAIASSRRAGLHFKKYALKANRYGDPFLISRIQSSRPDDRPKSICSN